MKWVCKRRNAGCAHQPRIIYIGRCSSTIFPILKCRFNIKTYSVNRHFIQVADYDRSFSLPNEWRTVAFKFLKAQFLNGEPHMFVLNAVLLQCNAVAF